MGYTALEDIQAEFKNITFSSTTNVKDSDIDVYIVQADALINSYVGKRYTLPVSTSAEGYQLLKMISTALVADRVRARLEVKQSTNATANQQPRRLMDVSTVMQILKDIASGAVPLVGIDVASNGSGIYSENNYEMREPEFKKDESQW